MLSLPDLPTCPGLLYGSVARDGILSRMRIPGGILNAVQCCAIADLADELGGGYVQVTNRANLQIREMRSIIGSEVFAKLQQLGIAPSYLEIDPLRNIMASPTAGIDSQQLLDTRLLVKELDDYLQRHPELSALSPKFSICFDGGESVSVRDRLNDIILVAESRSPLKEIVFRLFLNDTKYPDTGIIIPQSQCISVLAACAQVYLNYTKDRGLIKDRKPRLRHLLADWGQDFYLEQIEKYLSFPLQRISPEKAMIPVLTNGNQSNFEDKQSPVHTKINQDNLEKEIDRFPTKTTTQNLPNSAFSSYNHLGIHPQDRPDLSYIGIALPLGKLESKQLRSLANLALTYGSGTIRLTPWQNLLISDIQNSQLPDIKQAITALGLHWSANRLDSALIACSGKTGCAAGATDTQGDALKLARDLATKIMLDRPIKIHFSGCKKSCAQHNPSEITLLGTEIKNGSQKIASYIMYVGAKDSPFGRQLFPAVSPAELLSLIERMLLVYQKMRSHNESFGEFADRHPISQLQQWLNPTQIQHSASHSVTEV
ncbi:precorrin-3B synthase [Kamptonema sp. UHCC 0994]|uniref:precorrin-3B synthase n=1 Tax=Kamptonema sp. UHCC 0994 TaxID=3031329 RepID=UPI0023B9A5DC|nr:precorrin-3B synthase [Kamptonema sp. UHCC 0994]MDF0555559.1 precorrin-3B synthase [Kamptonema sp. UHCC 0994]